MPNAPTALSWITLSATFGALVATLILPAGASQTAKAPDGKALFQNRCAKCHGFEGQGGPGYKTPLRGTLSVMQLASFIERSMPPGPKKCPGADAQRIAPYIFDAFYSPLAQERNRPARIRLVRLTVNQFKNAVSDLIGGFHSVVPYKATHGLRAEYFNGRSRDAKNRVIDRIDPDIRLDFGAGAPAPKGFDANNFSIAWSGSVFAPDTGEYEFSIHSRHSCQMWFNGSRYPTVDGEVRSANDADPRGTVTLQGGRSYSIYMVFTKATQGVDDPKKKPKTPEPSYVTLNWTRPGHVEEPIPTQFLYSVGSPRNYVVTTPFPPDDRSTGYERGDSVSKDWDDATTTAALEAAEYVSKNVKDVTGVQDGAPDRDAKLKAYCSDLLQRAFRRPLSDDVKRIYIDKQFVIAASPEDALKRVVVLALTSPRFLYRGIGDRHDGYAVASDLAFDLWDTVPDPELERAASSGDLAKRENVVAQATRMGNDFRAWDKLRGFLLLWLKVDEAPDLVKNRKHFPDFDAAACSDLRTSLELFLQNTAWSESSDYRELMLSEKVELNGRLAKIYGANVPADAPFESFELDKGQRSGLLTQPYLLSRFAYFDGSSPIHRGVLIDRNLLGRVLNPPPANFAPLSASVHPDLTTRQRVALQTKPQFCNNCHGIINPLGYTLERFDAVGKIRSADNGKPIDDSGTYRDRTGKVVRFHGALDLAKYLANSDEAHTAFVEKLFVNMVKQPPAAYGVRNLADLQLAFAENNYSIRKLMTAIAVATALPGDHQASSKRVGKL